MKLRNLAILSGITAALTAASCRFPAFAAFWAKLFSMPVLRLLRALSARVPFVILEWGIIGLAIFLLLVLARRGALTFLKYLCAAILSAGLAFSALWLPMYSVSTPPACKASPTQLTAACEYLILRLNTSPPDFSACPDDLPAKQTAFPFWMRALGISGFYSFFTGEALVSPELPPSALPFVAVHESMHAAGYAGEGEANIAAWNECLRLGGAYTDSALLWALRYCMAALKDADPAAHDRLHRSMNTSVFPLYRQVGGDTRSLPHSRCIQAFYSFLGIEEASGNYEILAPYLASRMPE